MFITRRHLLEWVTSGEVARSARTDLAGSYARNVVRAGDRARRRNFFGPDAAGALGGCPAILRPLAGGALDRVVDQPAHRAAGPGTQPSNN